VPLQLQSTKIKNDMDFEWMLCLANILYWLQNGPSPRNVSADDRPSGRRSGGAASATPSLQRNYRLNLRDVKNHSNDV
jgi:hypothetical protein